MGFSTWAALRTAIKDAIADRMSSDNPGPCIGSYEMGGRIYRYRNFNELYELYEKTFKMEAMENGVSTASRVSYGRHRRYAG